MTVYVNKSKMTAAENIKKYGFAIIHTSGDVVGDDTYLFIETETAYKNHIDRIDSIPGKKCEIADVEDYRNKIVNSYPFYTDIYQMLDDDGTIFDRWETLENKIKSEFNI